jgi:hypothetical protein
LVRRVTTILAALLLAGCTSAAALPSTPATPNPATGPPVTPGATVVPTPAATPEPTPSPSPSPTPSLSPGASPTPSASPSAPTAARFWSSAVDAIHRSGDRLEVAVRGPTSGELRFQKGTSATVIDGTVTFLCIDGRAYDGQSGFSRLEGSWVCGSDALAKGFRTMGQPVDAWSDDLLLDVNPRETVDVLGNGDWRWRYRASNPLLGAGDIRVTLVLRPSTGRIVSGSRTDPLGETTWAFAYGADFPEIARP